MSPEKRWKDKKEIITVEASNALLSKKESNKKNIVAEAMLKQTSVSQKNACSKKKVAPPVSKKRCLSFREKKDKKNKIRTKTVGVCLSLTFKKISSVFCYADLYLESEAAALSNACTTVLTIRATATCVHEHTIAHVCTTFVYRIR